MCICRNLYTSDKQRATRENEICTFVARERPPLPRHPRATTHARTHVRARVTHTRARTQNSARRRPLHAGRAGAACTPYATCISQGQPRVRQTRTHTRARTRQAPAARHLLFSSINPVATGQSTCSRRFPAMNSVPSFSRERPPSRNDYSR